jgi:hypothetical protein
MSVLVYFVLLFAFVSVKCEENLLDFSIIKTTIGEPWPMPQSINPSPIRVSIRPESFSFLYNETSHQCALLDSAFVRYYKLIFFPETYWDDLLDEPPRYKKKFIKRNLSNLGDIKLLKNVQVNIQQMCEQWPTFKSNESCK